MQFQSQLKNQPVLKSHISMLHGYYFYFRSVWRFGPYGTSGTACRVGMTLLGIKNDLCNILKAIWHNAVVLLS